MFSPKFTAMALKFFEPLIAGFDKYLEPTNKLLKELDYNINAKQFVAGCLLWSLLFFLIITPLVSSLFVFWLKLPFSLLNISLVMISSLTLSIIFFVAIYYYPSRVYQLKKTEMEEEFPESIMHLYLLSAKKLSVKSILRILSDLKELKLISFEAGKALTKIERGSSIKKVLIEASNKTPSPNLKHFFSRLLTAHEKKLDFHKSLKKTLTDFETELESKRQKNISRLLLSMEFYTILFVLPLIILVASVVSGNLQSHHLIISSIIYFLLPVIMLVFLLASSWVLREAV
ncbi:MAG: type II secretion system F family protein [archaeon]